MNYSIISKFWIKIVFREIVIITKKKSIKHIHVPEYN